MENDPFDAQLLFIWFPDLPGFGSWFQITRRRRAQGKGKTPKKHRTPVIFPFFGA